MLRGRRIGRLLTTAAALTLAAAAWSPTASAAQYTVSVCPAVLSLSDQPFNLSQSIQCSLAQPRILQTALLPDPNIERVNGTVAWTITAPPGTAIASLETDRGIQGTWFADSVKWEMRTAGPLGGSGVVLDHWQSNPNANGDFTDPPTVHETYDFAGATSTAGVPEIESIFGCLHPAAANDPCDSFRDGYGVVLTNAIVHMDDSIQPATPQLSGPLLSGGPQDGTQTLQSDASDVGSGVKTASLFVDGVLISTLQDPEARCETSAYTDLAPCAAHLVSRFSVDTTRLSEGTHTATVTATDVAGNPSNAATAAFTVRNTPSNTAPPLLTGSAALGGQLAATTGTWDVPPTGFSFKWLRCPATVTTAAGAPGCTPIPGALDAHLYTPTSADAGERIMVQVTVRNTLAPKTGPVSAFSAPSAIVPAIAVGPGVPIGPGVPGTPPGSPPGSDHTPPLLSGISLSHARFRAVAKGTASQLRLTISEAGRLTILIERALPGKQVEHGAKLVCTAVRTPVKRGRCTLYRRATTIARTIAAGRASIALNGRVGARKMAPGAYRITLVARDAAGNASAAKRLTFTLLPG